MSRKADTGLIVRALAHAIVHRNYPQDVMFHSDRGRQYNNMQFQKYLELHVVKGSMSRKDNPFDDFCCESFLPLSRKNGFISTDMLI
jgi:putative transposase